ncbi:MAG: hypothetical protein ACXAAH_09655 [Promethearchaeota archaeon]|jgi:hypothetical protein
MATVIAIEPGCSPHFTEIIEICSHCGRPLCPHCLNHREGGSYITPSMKSKPEITPAFPKNHYQFSE